jgi:uncharacterized protein YecT (DUF1311 family)
MRATVLAIVAIQIGLAHPASAENAADSGRSISEMLPLYNQNHCGDVKDPADQVFCGDPQLNAAAAKLNSAIQNRLDRLPDRRHAIEENAAWIKNRIRAAVFLEDKAFRARMSHRSRLVY